MRIGRRRIRAASTAASTMEHALSAKLLGEFDDQDGVLAGEADEHDQTDLAVHVILQSAQRLRTDGAEKRDGHGEQHDEGQHKTFVLGCECQVHDDKSQAEQN